MIEQQAPKVKLRVERRAVAEVLSGVLARHSIEDVTVEDPPLEEVIADMFTTAGEQPTDEQAIDQAAARVV